MNNEISSTLDHSLKTRKTSNSVSHMRPKVNSHDMADADTAVVYPKGSNTSPNIKGIDLDEVAEKINEYIQNIDRDLKFTVSEDTGRTIITVIDSETQKVIRQIPPEEMMRLARSLQDNSMNIIRVNV